MMERPGPELDMIHTPTTLRHIAGGPPRRHVAGGPPHGTVADGSLRRRLRAASATLATATLATLAVAAAASPIHAQSPTPDRFSGVRATIERVMAERNLPSVSVAAARAGEVVWEEAFGWADREGLVEATPHTMYSLASISKPVTATGLMVLAEAGSVDLDAPVDRYLGRASLTGLGGDAADATVRRVAAHTAGLPLHYQFFYEDAGYAPPSREETIRRYGVVAHPPGGEFVYSNLGYGILDHVITRVSGRPYADFLRTEVFVPLGLNRTAVGLPPSLRPHAAVRYGPDDRPIPFYRFDHPGASAVWSSVHDLVRFGLYHLGHLPRGARPILSDGSLASMRERATPEPGTGYGIGWFIDDELGHRKVWHTGSMPGVSTMLALYPDLDIVVVVLMNALARDLRVTISQDIVAALDEEYARAREEARSRVQGPETGRERDRGDRAHGFDPPSALVGSWAGTLRTWDDELSMELIVDPDGDIHVDVEGQLETILVGADFVEARLQGRYAGRIPTPDVMRHPLHSVYLDLRLDGDRLYGQASAQTEAEPTFYSLASYVELARAR